MEPAIGRCLCSIRPETIQVEEDLLAEIYRSCFEQGRDSPSNVPFVGSHGVYKAGRENPRKAIPHAKVMLLFIWVATSHLTLSQP